jgi:hypothetical protein
MKFNFLQKQTSRREMLRGSATLAGCAFLVHLFPTRLLRASAGCYPQAAPSPADLLASMRAKFNAVPMETRKLAGNVTVFDGPGGAVTVLNGPDGKFIVDTFVAARLAKTQRGSRSPWQCSGEIRHRHALALRPYRQQ